MEMSPPDYAKGSWSRTLDSLGTLDVRQLPNCCWEHLTDLTSRDSHKTLPTPHQLQADWLDTNREAPSRMWEGCSTLICWRSAAGGRRTGKGSDQQFPSQGTPSTPHHPPAFLPDNGWQLHSHHWLLQRPQLPHLLPAHSPDTLQLLCILLALAAHA